MLTDKEISNITGRDKPYRLTDGEGLYLEVKPGGMKYWRWAYRFAGKQKTLALGVYPAVKAKEARLKRADAKALLDQNIDPGQQRKVVKLTAHLSAANTFEAIAREWHENREDSLATDTASKTIAALKTYVFPKIGALPIENIEPAHLLAVVLPIDKDGKGETARRVRAWIDAVFRYAIIHHSLKINPAADLRSGEVFKPSKEKHLASLPIADLPIFLRSLDDPAKRVDYRTRLALRLLVLTFVRPGELNWAMWREFDIKAKEWRIPAERIPGAGKGMKMKEEHIVPLSGQALAVLEQLRPLTGTGKFLFPCVGRPGEAGMSENTLRMAVQKGLGFPVTAHGFRATATGALLELGWPAHVIDKQLSHQERQAGASFGAYSHQAEYLAERRKMMRAWGDYLQALEAGAKIKPIRAAS
jgi:integrase